MIKFGVADYGLNVWDGGRYDIQLRLEELKSIGFDGLRDSNATMPLMQCIAQRSTNG